MPVDFIEDQAAPTSIDFQAEEATEAPAARPRIVPPDTQLKLTPYQQAAAEGRDTGMWGEGPMAIARGQSGGGGEAIGATAAAIIPAAQAAGKVIGEGWEATGIPQVGRDLMSDFLVRTGIDPSSTPNPELGRVLNLPRLTPDMVSGLPQPLQIGAGVANVVPAFIEGIAQDPSLFVATFGTGTVPKVARTILGTQQLLELPQEIREAVKVWGDPKSSTAEKTQAILQPGVSAIFAREMVRHGWRPQKPEAITGEDLKGRPKGAPLPPQPPPVPTEPVPPRTAFPPGPAPTGPVPPREAFPPGPAPTAPVPPRESFPPGPAPAYPPNQQWAYRSDLPPGPAPRTPVPPRPSDVAPGTQPAVSAEVPAVTDFREASKIPGLEFQDWLDKHGGDLTRPTNAAYAMADAIKTPEDLATVEAAGADARKEVAAFREKARAAMAQNPEEGVKLLNKAAAFVSKIQYFDEAARMYKARQAVAGGMSTADAAKEFGVTEKHIGQPLKPSETQPTTPAAAPTEPPTQPASPAAEAVPAAPTAIEQTPLAGKTLGEWEAVKEASQLPKGEARAALAKWLAVPNQPARILQALANKKRTREIHAPPTEVAPVTPAAPPKAPAPAAPEGMLLDVPEVPRTGPAARAYLIRRLEELEDIDPITGKAEPKEDLTEAQEKARGRFRKMLAEVEQQIAKGEPPAPQTQPSISITPVGTQPPSVRVSSFEPKPAETKPAKTATPAPVPETKSPATATKPFQAGNPPPAVQQAMDRQAAIAKEIENADAEQERIREANKNTDVGSKESGENIAKINRIEIDKNNLQSESAKLQGVVFDWKWEQETARFRGQPEPEPSEPKVTSKVLKAQKENLLSQVDAAIKEAPEESTEKITISVPGDGEFTIPNTKEALKRFRDHTASEFPETVGGKGAPKLPPARGKAVPKVTEPKANDLPKVAGMFVSEDPNRFAIQTSYADGTQIVATDGRQLIRIVTPNAPGTPAAPVRLTPEGKIDSEVEGTYPNYNQVRPEEMTLIRGGVDTAELWKLARQGQVFLKDIKVKNEPYVRLDLFVNPDGSLGAKAEAPGVGTFEHNIQEGAYNAGAYNVDYLASMAEGARRLGNEKVDLYASDTTGPLGLVGKNHEHLLMAMRMGEGADIRDNPSKLLPVQTGQPMHTRPAKGFGPLADPEGFISNQLSTPNGEVRVASQGGRLTVEISRKNQHGGSNWVAVENFTRGEQNAKAIAEGIARATEKPIQSGTTKTILEGFKDLERQRQALIKEGEARKSQLGPTGGAGPGSPSITQGPDPQTMGLSAGSPTLNRLQRAFTNFYAGLGQLFKRSPVKQDLMTLANRATNLPKIVGQKAGNSIRLEAATRTAQQQEALTFLIQSLKMSGEGLSEEGAARLGKLEFEGDPTGYLRTKQADMETLAQQFLQQGKRLEAEAAIKAAKAMQYAREHFNELRPVADLFRRKTDLQHARLAAGGVDVNYENWYVPQRQDLDLMTGADRPIVLGHSLGTGVATGFEKAKVYEDYASAIEAGFIPRSLNAADLLENYVAQTERVLMRKGFFDAMREIPDPVDGKAVVINVPRRVITRPDGSLDVQETVPIGYTMSEVMPGARVAVHNGYNRLVKALTGSSQLAESAPVGTLQDIAAIEKHIGLALDTFHLSRVLQAELALTGKISVGNRLRMGRALVEYSPRDLDKAVTAGELTQEMADWIRTPQEMQVNGRAVRLNPQQVLNIGINNGLNIARFADVIYRDWLRETPILKETTGALNKLVFDKISRSAIAHGFSAEFERIAAQRPELTANQVAKQVARDINVMFGNLQKESFFRNPSLNSIMQILFLAPRWVESLARREARGAIQLGTAGVRLAQGKPANLGTVGKGIGTGLAAYFVGTQILNLITRHQLTFQNKERGHKLDAWIPDVTGKTSGFFISPLSVFGEITHDILRYADSKPDTASALTQIGANKLGNLGRFLEVVASGRDPMTGDKIIGSGRRAVRAGLQLIPVPITLSQGVRAAGHAVAPELIQAPPPGAVQRQVTASAGFKTEPAGSAQSQVYRMADDWKAHGTPKMQAELERRLKEDFGPSDYGPLRTALVRDDPDEARRAYQQLRQQGKTPKTIRQTLQHPHPFTGSAAAETKFKASLSPEDKETYRKAIEERKELYRRFQRMLNPPQQ